MREVSDDPALPPHAATSNGAPQATLLTVDIWDTILRRRCHPDEIKLFTARHLLLRTYDRLRPEMQRPWALFTLRQAVEHDIGRRRAAESLDDEYAIDEVFTEWIARATAPPPDHDELHGLADELIALEIAHEQAMVYPDDAIAATLRELSPAPPILLSDFYMRSAQLARIVNAAAPIAYEHIVVSCDVGLNKRSGRLFEHLYRQLGSAPALHLHVGDNPHADVAVPARLGARTLHYHNEPQERLRAAHQRRFARRSEGVGEMLREFVAETPDATADSGLPEASELFNLGRRYAPLFLGFSLFCVEQAARRRCDRVHYFTREGVFFRRLHEAMRPTRPLGVDLPASDLLEVSRLSTFMPSVREFTPVELMRIWNLYSVQSPTAFCKTLDLDPADVAPHFGRHGIDPDAPITYPWQSDAFVGWLADAAVQRLLESVRSQRRALLLRYLADRGIRSSDERCFIVDIGWRGTIQDNLAHLLPGTTIHAAYFGLQRFLNPQPTNATKTAFGPNENSDGDAETLLLLRHVSPVEMLTNSDTGSVTGYAERDGVVIALTKNEPAEDAVHARCIRHFQDGVASVAQPFGEWVRRHAVCAAELRPHCMAMLADLIHAAPRPLAGAYFALTHNETFGLGKYVEKRTRFPWRLALGGMVRPRKLKELARFLNDTGWPQGFLRECGLGLLCGPYNRVIGRRARAKLP